MALLMGADDADARPAQGAVSGVGGAGTLMLLGSAAAAEQATAGHAPILAQIGPTPFPAGSLRGLFNSGGLLGAFAAGFLGSGLLGLLFGRGLFGELGSAPSYLGLIFQLALLALLCRLIWTRWHAGDAAGVSALSPRQLADAYLRSRDDLHGGLDPSILANGATDTDAKPGTRRSEVTDPRGEPE